MSSATIRYCLVFLFLKKVWGYSYLGDSRLVDVAIQRLRSKTTPDLIETVRGVGYRAGS